MNNKTKNNTYGLNSSNCYNKQIKKTNVYYPINKNQYYDKKYENPYVLSGEVAGTVWTNDISANPGLGWIL